MKEWEYLWSEPFKSRSVLGAYFLRNCPTIIELGGYKTPITNFVTPEKKVFVIDPRTDELLCGNVQQLTVRFEDWQGELEKPYGVLILGLELHMPEEGWVKLFNLIEQAEVAVIEVPTEHIHSVQQFARICQNTTKKRAVRINLDLYDNDFGDMNNSAPPKCLRQINVLLASSTKLPDSPNH